MAKLAYDYTHTELVDAFYRAVARAGVSSSGLAIDIMAGHDRAEAFYFRGVLLSRLEGQKRPFTRGNHVKLDSRGIVRSVNTSGEYYARGQAEPGKTYEVTRTFYEGSGKWSLCLRDPMDDEPYRYRYPAEFFEKVEEAKTGASAAA